ncbi:putative orfan [Tupanvirus soda lake]|uniref:Orfan n=2 Tax=Tupanvirus TaxID=2094720 RepID=A0AC62AD85_9VIRU|nr:putative orfan [Tupanvirus soda lake]QKU35751.1 putative orfan [Tupanvirus soda lake]
MTHTYTVVLLLVIFCLGANAFSLSASKEAANLMRTRSTAAPVSAIKSMQDDNSIEYDDNSMEDDDSREFYDSVMNRRDLLGSDVSAAQAYRTWQVLTSFWFKLEHIFGSLCPANATFDDAKGQFWQLFNDTTTNNFSLYFPLALGTTPIVGRENIAEFAAFVYLGGQCGEHHVTSFPLVKSQGLNYALFSNDIEFTKSPSSETNPAGGDIYLGQKATLIRPTGKIHTIILDVRSTMQWPGAAYPWLPLETPPFHIPHA